MSIILFLVIHTIVGIALINFYSRLPKMITIFTFTCVGMSFIYVGAVLLNSFI
jgi:hypothetical protein